MKRCIVAMLLAGACVAQAAPRVVLKGGREVEGVSIRAKADGTIVLTRADGQQFTLTREQYVRAEADKPADFDRAVRLVQGKQYDEAIPLLRKIATELRFLTWDERALYALAKAYEGKGAPADAVKAYEELFQVNPEAEKGGEAMWGYFEALLATGREDKLAPRLDAIVREGTRPDAARAQIMRGDQKAKKGQFEEAVLDYLRTVMFYQREAAVLPAAYLKVASTLEKMRDNRAREWYKRLVEEFPESPEAASARDKV